MNKQCMYKQVFFSIALLACAGALTGCSSAVTLTSDWRKTDMDIDGNQNDWDGSLYLLKKADVTVGVRNDEKYLYVCFISDDASLRRMVMHDGFIVWFDTAGGKSKQYGIKFPVGGNSERMRQPINTNDETLPPDTGSGIKPAGENEGFRQRQKARSSFPIMDDGQRSVEFIRSDGSPSQDLLLIELKSMKVKYNSNRNAFIYELQVPLHKTREFPFELMPKDGALGIGFLSEKGMEASGGSKDHERGMNDPGNDAIGGPGGEGMEGPGGYGRGRYGQGQGGNPHASENLEVWVKAHMAAKPSE